MIMKGQFKINRIIVFVLLLFSLFTLEIGQFNQCYAAGKEKSTRRKKRNIDEIRRDFFGFTTEFFTWFEDFLRRVDKERRHKRGKSVKPWDDMSYDRHDLYGALSETDVNHMFVLLEENKDLLKEAYKKRREVYKFKTVSMIPEPIFNYIINSFVPYKIEAYNKAHPNDPYYPKDYVTDLLAMILDINYNPNLKKVIKGRVWRDDSELEKIANFDMNEWEPISAFLQAFRDSLLNENMKENLGGQLYPFFEEYFRHMDPISRMRLYRLVSSDYDKLEKKLKEKKSAFKEKNELAISIFLSCGPTIIKFLQQMREDLKGIKADGSTIGAIAGLLEALENGRPMTQDEVNSRIGSTLFATKNLNKSNYDDLEWTISPKPLSIASIAEARILSYTNTKDKSQGDFVVKLQRSELEDVIFRENRLIERVFTDKSIEDKFDKGLKKTLFNMRDGITEEKDFRIEKNNLFLGQKYYIDGVVPYNTEGLKITSIYEPKEFHEILEFDNKRYEKLRAWNDRYPRKSVEPEDFYIATRKVLVMNKAAGKEVKDIINGGDAFEQYWTYQAIADFYRLYLHVALTDGFFHGDTHRGNIFADKSSKTLTIIDLGNAGILDEKTRMSILRLLSHASKTEYKKGMNEKKFLKICDQGILDLAGEISKLVLETDKEIKNDPQAQDIMHVFFGTCFNPKANYDSKVNSFQKLEQMKPSVSKANQDFIRALQKNCLAGTTHPIRSLLRDKNKSASEKLNTLFRHLNKNGIALPDKMIFFNKSKRLLEGIMESLKIEIKANMNVFEEKDFINPDVIFNDEIKKLKEGIR